jgi:2-oxoglutarate/2-oxoacid ferredoxin oxidoreductase subunit alpha
MNFTSQFAAVLRENTLIAPDHEVVKYNGRAMSCEEIYNTIKDIDKGTAAKRVVLNYGS